MFALVAAIVSVFGRVAAETHSEAAGLFVAVAMVVFWVVMRVVTRRRSRERAVAYGPLKLDMTLDFACLPGDWPALALETLPAAAANVPGLSVTVEAVDGWLRVDKRRVLGTGRHPFSARVPLAAIRDVWASKSILTLAGASIIFALDDGSEIRGDLPGAVEEAEAGAERFVAAIAEARRRRAPGPLVLQVTSPPPPPRTPPRRAALLMMASFVPFAVAMAGAPDGPCADIATLGVLFLALGLNMKRPVSMPTILAKAHGVAAVAFAIDAVHTGEPLRFVGTLACIALARWMLSLQPPGHGAPGPA